MNQSTTAPAGEVAPPVAVRGAGRPGRTGSPGAVSGGRVARAEWLETLLGDPFDDRNPHGMRALLQADERRSAPEATERLLNTTGLGAEFVPRELGGRLTGVEELAQVLRPVFRRDVALGFGAGVTALFAASVVWAAGDERQRRAVARLLLDGGRITILHREFAHANAILRGEYRARSAPDGGHLISGRKSVVINADRADAFVAYVRTSPGDGPHSHSVFLLEPGRLPSHALRRLPRVQTTGMRGAHYAGLELADCPVPADALVGRVGEGVPLALRTFQVSRSLVSGSALIAGMDSALRYAVRAVAASGRARRSGGRRQRLLAGVFADLLAGDSLAVTGLRLLDLAPEHALVPSAAVKYAVTSLLHEDLDDLASALGSRGYDRGPHYGGFSKLVRDLPVAGLGHAGTVDIQALLVPHLRTLAHAPWIAPGAHEAPALLFTPGDALDSFDFRRLSAEPADPHGGCDGLLTALVGATARLDGRRGLGSRWAALADLAAVFAEEVRRLAERCAALAGPRDGGPPTDPAALVLADRYCLLAAVATCLGMRENADGGFLAGPEWPLLALTRIGRRLGLGVADVPDEVTEALVAELLARYETGRSFDLYGTRLAGTPD